MAKAPPKEAAAAAAIAGAAAVGGKLAWDKVSSRKAQEARAYRLDGQEHVPDGMRRVARGQLENGLDDLDGEPSRKLDDAVHASRKRLKRLRASLRLGRGALGEPTYKRENKTFRDLGRRLAGPRDAAVLVETLDGLTERFGDELGPEAMAPLHRQLERAHDAEVKALSEDQSAIGEVRDELESARTRTAAWSFDGKGFGALRPGLKKIYRRGRKSMRAAADDPSTERLHEWRKRTKDLWHAEQLLRPADPKRMKKLAKRTHDLSDLLGDDHDLAVLEAYVREHPGALPVQEDREALLAVIARRREKLQRKAFALGGKLYRRSPKRFVKRVERGWKKRAADTPPQVAG
jgi:CHAD domain-containing protein